ncbi:MAG: DNA methyltransferase [Candidatus Brocadiales bacterium]|nr:DNA methyltransferase [Candidatus Brocadiales bacterium]
MQALLNQGYEGKINLIYIDPPFDSKADYSHKMTITPTLPSPIKGEGTEKNPPQSPFVKGGFKDSPPLEKGGKGGFEFTKEPSVIERLAYKDTWAGGTDSYLDMLYPRLQLMKRLLAEDGSIYVHLDWHVCHYVKIMLDEIFGKENFRNEIFPKRKTKNLQNQFEKVRQINIACDSLLWYSKNTNARFFPPTQKSNFLKDFQKDQWNNFYNNADRPSLRYPLLGIELKEGQWRWTQDKAEEAVKNYQEYKDKYSDHMSLYEYWEKTGRSRRFIKRDPGSTRCYYWVEPKDNVILDTNWDDIYAYDNSPGSYITQKSEAFLERIIKMGTKDGNIVADFFSGSGTTLAVAERLGRRWIGCELGKVGIQVTRARLVESEARPFLIENIGNYQREMIYLTGGRIYEMQNLVLKLYGATPRDKMSGLGVRKVVDTPLTPPPLYQEGLGVCEGKGVCEELVYVGYPDRPVTAGKAEELALQAQKLDGRGYKRLVILGWDYEYNYQQSLEARKRALKDKLKVEIISRDIPPDIYDYLKKAKTDEDIEALSEKIRFYERPYLKMNEPKIKDLKDGKIEITLSIKRYVLMDIPISQTSKKGQEDYAALMKIAKDNFAVLIDYWAVDWDYDGFTFKSQWQAFRGNGKKAKTVTTGTKEVLEKKKRTIAVRVVDIFGNDAGAVIEIS